MLHKRTLLFALLCIVAIAAVPSLAAAESVNGTVTVENGTADGAKVTVTPLDQNYRRVGTQINTTVDGSSFTATGLPDAPLYFVRVTYDGETHYALAQNATAVDITLSAEFSGRLVNESGAGQSGVPAALFSSYGPMVDRFETGENGTFSVGPLKPNSTYYLQYSIGGIPYNQTIETDASGDPHRIVAQNPTSNLSALQAMGGAPASHVIQVLTPKNQSGPVVVESITLRDTRDRPFVGAIKITLPKGANATAAMYENKAIPVTQHGRTVSINATIAPGQSVQVGVAYPLQDQTLTRTVRYSPGTVAVVLRPYNVSRVQHSSNLVRVNSPVPILAARNISDANETVSVTLPEQPAATDPSFTPDDGSNSGFSTPVIPLAVGLVGAIGGGLLAYRVL